MRRLVSRCMVSGATLAACALVLARAAAFCQPPLDGISVVTAHEHSHSATALEAYHLGVVADESFPEDGNWLLDDMLSA